MADDVTHLHPARRKVYDSDLACGVLQRGGFKGSCACGYVTPWCYTYAAARDLIRQHKAEEHPRP